MKIIQGNKLTLVLVRPPSLLRVNFDYKRNHQTVLCIHCECWPCVWMWNSDSDKMVGISEVGDFGQGWKLHEHGRRVAVIHSDSGVWRVRTAAWPAAFWSLFSPPSVLHLRALLRHQALDTPWMAQDFVHFLKIQDPFSKQKGISGQSRFMPEGQGFQDEFAWGSPGNGD